MLQRQKFSRKWIIAFQASRQSPKQTAKAIGYGVGSVSTLTLGVLAPDANIGAHKFVKLHSDAEVQGNKREYAQFKKAQQEQAKLAAEKAKYESEFKANDANGMEGGVPGFDFQAMQANEINEFIAHLFDDESASNEPELDGDFLRFKAPVETQKKDEVIKAAIKAPQDKAKQEDITDEIDGFVDLSSSSEDESGEEVKQEVKEEYKGIFHRTFGFPLLG